MVRTRFAPSPTGYLHIGGVRTALFNWLFARQNGGQFILRIDDTDNERNCAEALQPILDGFTWLGLNWDEGPTPDGTDSTGPHSPYFQSQRSAQHREAVETLLARGFAYRDYATPDEVKLEREAAEREKRPFVYSRKFMAENDEQATAFEAEGRRPVVRLKMPREGECRFVDLVRGEVAFEWAAEQDHVIQRTDGSCLYHLATVVDDHDFEITHVIRAVEHLSNTPRQIFIAESLGYDVPQFAHLPFVAAPGGKEKLSKRKLKDYLKNREFKALYDHGCQIAAAMSQEVEQDTFNPVIVDFYREVGYLPDAVINYLLLLGWSLDDKTEEFTPDEMIRLFSLERVNRAPASFDPQKLLAFQTRAMLAYPSKKKVAFVLPFLQRAGLVPTPPPCDMGPKISAILDAAGDRVKVAGDMVNFAEFFLDDDQIQYVEKDFEKRLRKPPEAKDLLSKYRNLLEAVEPFEPQPLEDSLKSFVEVEGIKIGQIIHALRVAVTGKAVGIGMFDTLALIGKSHCLNRIDRALSLV